MPKSITPTTPQERRGIWLNVAAALVWPVQAAVLAWTIGPLLTAPGEVRAGLAALVFLALALLRVILSALAERDLSAVASATIEDIHTQLVIREAAAEAPSALGGAGAIAALATEKPEVMRAYLLRFRPARMRSAVVPVVILVLSAWWSWAVALVLLMAGPLIPVFMALVGWAAKSASERQMAEIGGLNDLLADRLAALADLRLIGAGQTLIDGFATASEGLRHRTMTVLSIAFLSSTVLELFSALGVAMVAIWVGFTLLGELGWGSWGAPLSPAAGIFLLLLAPEFFQPLRDLAAAWHDRAAAEAVTDEVAAWQAEERAERLGAGRLADTARGACKVRLQGLHHRGISYPDLDIAPGDTLALTGASGSGKTSLLRLIAGLDRPEAGAVLLDGVPLDDAAAPAWWQGLGWMPQAPHFLNRSLRYNIGFGAPVRNGAIAAADLGQVMAALPTGDLTQLGERGAGLSGGEARRVTLARALQGQPALILADEPTADLDAETAAAVIAGLLDYAVGGGTLIVATHDPALAGRMGRVVHLGAEGGA